MSKVEKLPAGALVITLMIALVLSVVSSMLILLGYHNRQIFSLYNVAERLRNNLSSASNLILADNSFYTNEKVDTLDLFQERGDSAIIKRAGWGLFQVAAIECKHFNFSKKRQFLYGSSMPDYMSGCIYLADRKRPLSLVGNTILTGKGYLPKAGLKIAYVDQRGYDNSALISGEVKPSEENIPAINVEFTGYLENIADYTKYQNSMTGFSDLEDSGIHRSFSEKTLQFYQSGNILLKEASISGNIIIISDSSIEVTSTANLENVILVAPYIKFTEGVRGSVQAFATDSITVGKDCSFAYPSAIALIKNKNSPPGSALRIAGNCFIEGIVLSWCSSEDQYRPQLQIDEGVKITGIVYSSGYLFLKGEITGALLANTILYRNNGSVYENFLVDTHIDRDKLSPYFLTSPLFRDGGTKEVIEWLE